MGGLTTVGCGGGGDGNDDVASGGFGGVVNPPEPEGSGGAGSGDAAGTGSVAIGESVHFAGFVFDLGQAELGPSQDFEGNPDPSIGRLTIDAVIENLGEDDAAPDQAELHLEQDGRAVNLDPLSFEGLPTVPGGSTTNAEIVFDGLPADFGLEGTELVFGDGTVNQARVPLGDGGELVALEPIEITRGQPGQAGEVTITVTGGHLMYGNPTLHSSVEEGTAILVVELDVTASPALRDTGGGVNVQGQHLRLVLPDGTSVADVGTAPNEILNPGATLSDLVAWYEVPAEVRGPLQLAMRGLFGSDHGTEVEGAATFELTDPPASEGGGSGQTPPDDDPQPSPPDG